MGISNSEHITRIGLFYSRATRVKAKMLLNIEHVIFINLYVMLYAEICPNVRRHNARPEGGCVMLSNLRTYLGI
jgi:hypothetical protein